MERYTKKKVLKKVMLVCSCARLPNATPVAAAAIQRIRPSRRTDCLFALDITRKDRDNAQWVLEVKNADHNHEPFEDVSVHPIGRKLNKEQHCRVLAQLRMGTKAIRIAADTEFAITTRDIFNIKQNARNKFLAGRTPLKALLDDLAPSTTYFMQLDSQNRHTHLLIVAPSAREICEKSTAGRVWLIDATHKNNKLNMPMVHLVGVTSTS